MSQNLVLLSTVLLHGLAYGMVLFLISVGLSVTMGLMGFVNLAHGVFAMLGGYVMVTMIGQFGVPYWPAVIIAALGVAAMSVPAERLLYARLYGASELRQVLMTIGLILVVSAIVRYLWGPLPQPLHLPPSLTGSVSRGSFSFPIYRLVIIAWGLGVALLLWLALDRTLFGARIRAAVDNRRMAESAGIDTRRIFTVTFALGSGMAALGGALGADLLAVNPAYAMEYLVYFMIVVAVGGMGTIRGPFLAAALLGILDTGSKYLVPQVGAAGIYLAVFALLLWRPDGLLGRAGGAR